MKIVQNWYLEVKEAVDYKYFLGFPEFKMAYIIYRIIYDCSSQKVKVTCAK